MDSLINSFEQTHISNNCGQCTEKFLKDITEILDNIIRYFYISGVIYSDISIILDILSHNKIKRILRDVKKNDLNFTINKLP